MSNLNSTNSNQQIILNFVSYLEQNKSKNTVLNFKYTLNSISYLNFMTCQQHDLLTWRKQFVSTHAVTTSIQRIVLVRIFFKYMQKVGIRVDNPSVILEIPRKEKGLSRDIKLIKRSQYDAIYKSTLVKPLDKLIISLGQLAGLRISEVASLRFEHIDLINNKLIVKASKGNKTRIVPISNQLKSIITDYLEYTRISDGYIIRTGTRDNMTTKQIGVRFNKVRDEFGINKDCNFHKCRHYFCSNLLSNPNISTKNVSMLMGHSSIKTTEIYFHTNDEECAEQMLSIMNNMLN